MKFFPCHLTGLVQAAREEAETDAEAWKRKIIYSSLNFFYFILPERGMLTKVLLPDCRLVGAVGVPIRVNYGPGVKTLQIGLTLYMVSIIAQCIPLK